MPKSKTRAGVSRQVKFSQLGPQGQSQTTILNQTAIARQREAAGKLRSNFLQGMLCPALLKAKVALNRVLLYSELGDEGKRLLEEFSGTPHAEPVDTSDPGPPVGDEQPWEALGQEGIAQGLVDDVRGLPNGK